MRATFCPSRDHDGGELVPVTRHIDAVPGPGLAITHTPSRIEAARCAYCAETYVAVKIREGWRVTVWAVEAVRA